MIHSSLLFICLVTDVKRSFTFSRLFSSFVANPSIALRIDCVDCLISSTLCFKQLISCLRSVGIFLQAKHTHIPIGSSF